MAGECRAWGGDASAGPLLSNPLKVTQGKRKGAARGDMQEGGFQF